MIAANPDGTVLGQTILLKPFAAEHLEASRQWFNDPDLAKLLDRSRQITAEEHQMWFQSLSARQDIAYFAIESNEDGKHIGNVWLADIDRRHQKAELRIVIGNTAYTGRGAGTEAISLLSRYGFDKLGMHKITSYVLSINLRALRSFQKAGFVVEGRLRKDRHSDDGYIDVYLLGLLKEDLPGR